MSKKTEEPQGQAINIPKNIQQIGSTDNTVKIYLEDYSGTYLRRILSNETNTHGILLGRKRTEHNQTYLFINAVLSVDMEPQEQYWKYDWNKIYELMQKYFLDESKEKPEILGWAMPLSHSGKPDRNELEKMHKHNFDGNMTLAFTLDVQEGKEQFYILENNQFHSIDGYYIYYEKNKEMQAYVLENQPGPCVETEDIVKGNGESYRTILLRRKELVQKRHAASMLYVASTFLIMIVIVLGITMMNNYEKMQKMQEVLGELSKSVVNEEPDRAGLTASASENAAKEDSPETVQAMARAGVARMSEQPMLSMQPAASALTAASAAPSQSPEPGNTDDKTGASAVPQATKSPEPSKNAVSSEAPQDTKSSDAPQNSRKRYEIQPGDTLVSISIRMYNTEEMVDKICEYNNIEDGNQIVAGDVLILP